MAETARRAAIATLVAGSIVVLALALWKLKLILSLVLLGFIIAAAMRPGVEALHRRRVPRAAGILINYAVILGAIGLFLSLVVPRAVTQVREAIGDLPTTPGELDEAAQETTGLEHDILVGLQRRLEDLPSATELAGEGVEVGLAAFEVVIGIFFVLATAAYWIFERDRAVNLVCRVLPRRRRKLVRDTWSLIDLKLGAYVRGQAVLIVLVGTVLSIVFMAIGLPYWILIGAFAGVVEIIPVIGPLAAGALAVGVGLTESIGVAAAAGIAVLVVRLLEDYLILPRVLGEAVGLSPLLVLVSVTSVAILFGAFAVILAVPLAALLATLVDVVVLNKNPAEEEVPSVIFPAKEVET